MPPVRVYLTGDEPTLAGCTARLGGGADICELRLDLLDRLDDDTFAWLQRHGDRVAVVCRTTAEGGLFTGPPAESLRLLERARASGARYVELDLEAAQAMRAGGKAEIGAGQGRIVRHQAGAGCSLQEAIKALHGVPAELRRLDLRAEHAGHLLDLLNVDLSPDDWLLTATGAAGAWVHLRPSTFGSRWSVLCADKEAEGSESPPSWSRAQRWRLFEHQHLGIMALLGGPRVLLSPGPDVYNTLFAHMGLPFQYLALPAPDLGTGLTLCRRLHAVGMSVTVPFKQEMHRRCTEVGPWATSTGVVNTAKATTTGWRGWNTDAPAIAQVLARKAPRPYSEALILGSGATASSVQVVLESMGISATVAARSPQRVAPRLLARGCAVLAWDQRQTKHCDLLFNCTPVGATDDETPWPTRTALPAPLVVDFLIRTDRESTLLSQSRKEGRDTVSGLDLWCHQGAHQMSVLTDTPLSAEMLRRVICDLRLNPTPPTAQDPPPITTACETPTLLPVPGSKSLTQRYLLLAALADSPSRLERGSHCADSRLLGQALEHLGARVTFAGSWIDVQPIQFTARVTPTSLWCGAAGTTARFLAALALLSQTPFQLDGVTRLRERPMQGLFDALTALGAKVQCAQAQGHLPAVIHVPGPLAHQVAVPVSQSSQFASALLLVAARLPLGLSLTLQGPSVSQPYIDLTLAALRRYGISVDTQGQTMTVQPRRYPGQTVTVEADWSAAAFWLVAGRITGQPVDMPGLEADSDQQDRRITVWLDEMFSAGKGFFDLVGSPDLLPPLAIAALFAPGPVSLRGAAHARLKECDRPAALAAELAKTGAHICTRDDGLDIRPALLHGGVRLDPHQDHRLAMAFGILSLMVPGIEILDQGCVAKSYPEFWTHLGDYGLSLLNMGVP